MGWGKRIGLGVGVIFGLLIVGAVGVWIWAPWIPPIVVSSPGSKGRRIIERGLLANYFPGQGSDRRPAILVLGGSEGGLGEAVTHESIALSAQGYAVMNLSYFRGPGQPENLELIPLEMFTNALDWLRAQPEVLPDRVAIFGGSKGAEAALLVASRHPELRAVVAAMPSSVAWTGVRWKTFNSNASSWSEGGKPVPWLTPGKFNFERMKREGLISIYADGLVSLPQHPNAAIPVERIRAPILLLCGEGDTLWPSCKMSRQIDARAALFGRHNVQILAYADAGHAVLGLPRRPGDPAIQQLGSLGGTPNGNNLARADSWPKVLAFLADNLKR